MSISNKDLKQYCLEFIQESMDICKNLADKEPVEELEISYPKFVNKKFDNIMKKKIKNYYEFVGKNEDEICSNDKFIIANAFLSEQKMVKSFFQEKYEKSEGVKTINVEDSTRELLLIFLIQYLELSNEFAFNRSLFDKTFKQFLFYITNEIRTIDFFTPLHNFDSDIERFVFGDIVLRRIKESEFMFVSGLSMLRNYGIRVPPDLLFLTHIIEISIPYMGNSLQENNRARQKFEDFIRCLSLFQTGETQIGALYRNHLNLWRQQSRSIDGKEIHNKSQPLKLHKKDCNIFLKFFDDYNSIDWDKKEIKFLKMAIHRFDSAIKKPNLEEKIVDFMIALESLYTSGPGDTRMKMSNRIATLLGKSEEEKESLWVFSSGAYNVRSGIVHGEGIRSVKIGEKNYTLTEISVNLEKITRDSIRKFLNMAKYYTGTKMNEKMIDDIDTSLINRNKLSELIKKTIGDFSV